MRVGPRSIRSTLLRVRGTSSQLIFEGSSEQMIRGSRSRVRGARSELFSEGQIKSRPTFEGLEDLIGVHVSGFVGPDQFGVRFRGFVGPGRSSFSRARGIRSIRGSLARIRGARSEGSWGKIDPRLTFKVKEVFEDLIGAHLQGFVGPDRFGVHFPGLVGPRRSSFPRVRGIRSVRGSLSTGRRARSGTTKYNGQKCNGV